MGKKKFKLKSLFKEADSRFLVSCGLKFCSIYSFIALFIFYVTWVVLSINNVFFEAKGFEGTAILREAFFDHVFATANDKLFLILGFYIFLFFAGMYIGKILLRPFKLVGEYCSQKSLGQNIEYNPSIFSDYKLLTRFSELFFSYLDHAKKEKKLTPGVIPPQFSKIRTPIFETVFFFHFLLFISIIALATSIVSLAITSEIQSQLMSFSLAVLNENGKTVGYFLENQKYIFDSINIVVVASIYLGYFVLGVHLFGKVSAAIFAFFLTMRAFMKGNHSARIHLIGFAHIRPHGRAFNKYLDFVERDFSKSKNNVLSINKKDNEKTTQKD